MSQVNEKSILDLYKKYDYLNCNSTLIKILVSYIKPSFLYKSEILTPIHLGRAVERDISKEGYIEEEDIKWLHENCIGDDDFEGNISYTNRRVGFLTGTYWAWKNYEKLGNPEYFGSFGYRRLYNPAFLKNLTEYDCIVPLQVDFSKTGPSIREHVLKLQGDALLKATINIFNKIYPNENKAFLEYLEMHQAFMYELYVMKKNIFFEFCEWINPLILEFLKIPPSELSFINKDSLAAKYIEKTGESRDIAYAIEILTGYFCYQLTLDKNIKIKYEEIVFIKDKLTIKNRNQIISTLIHEKFKSKKEFYNDNM